MIVVKAHWNGGPVVLTRVSLQRRTVEAAREIRNGMVGAGAVVGTVCQASSGQHELETTAPSATAIHVGVDTSSSSCNNSSNSNRSTDDLDSKKNSRE